MNIAARPSLAVPAVAATVLIVLIGCASYALNESSSPPSGIHVSGLNWTLRFLVAPLGPAPPLWYPTGSCMNLTGWVAAGTNITCSFYWVGEHCLPTGGTSAACSSIVGAIVAPPFTWTDTTVELFCPSGGCGLLALTIHVPLSSFNDPLIGTLLFEAYYHT